MSTSVDTTFQRKTTALILGLVGEFRCRILHLHHQRRRNSLKILGQKPGQQATWDTVSETSAPADSVKKTKVLTCFDPWGIYKRRLCRNMMCRGLCFQSHP